MLVCFALAPFVSAITYEDFELGVYYQIPRLAQDNFDWDYAFMDLARIGCNRMVVGGSCSQFNQFWAAAKHWGIKGIASYGRLAEYPGPGWDPNDMIDHVLAYNSAFDSLSYNGELVGDNVIGYAFVDEPEAHGGLDEDRQDYLRAYADIWHQYESYREIYVNHSYIPWYDLHEDQVSVSTGPTIIPNGARILSHIGEAHRLGFDNFTVVAQVLHIAVWMDHQCSRIEAFGFGDCSQEVFDWLDSRSRYQDVYEEMLAAYTLGAKGFTAYQYNAHSFEYSLVDIDGNDNNGKRAGYSDAAHDIRAAQGWPGVKLYNNGQPFNDRGNYPPGQFTLTADATSSSGTIEKVIFGKTTDGGGIWTTIEAPTGPYSATFSASSGETVIFRAQAVDTAGKKSIYDAYMIYIN